LAGRSRAGHEAAAVELAAIDPEEIDLVLAVRLAHIPVRRASTREEVDYHHVALFAQSSPFALNAPETVSDLKRQI
jgi:hypothetical protein